MKRLIQFPFLLIIFFISSNLNAQERSMEEQDPVLNAFTEFRKVEEERKNFKKELQLLDSLVDNHKTFNAIKENQKYAYENNGLPKKSMLVFEQKGGVIQIDFPQMYCGEYITLKGDGKLENLEKLQKEGVISINCRSTASDLDYLPVMTGSLSVDCVTFLNAIEGILNANQDVMDGFTFSNYLELERTEHINTVVEKFEFRMEFLKFLKETYFLTYE